MAAFPPPPALSAQASQDVFVYPNELPADHPRRIANDRLVYLGRMQAEIVFMEIMDGPNPQRMLARFMESVAQAYQWSRQVQGYPRQGFKMYVPRKLNGYSARTPALSTWSTNTGDSDSGWSTSCKPSTRLERLLRAVAHRIMFQILDVIHRFQSIVFVLAFEASWREYGNAKHLAQGFHNRRLITVVTLAEAAGS